jgi:predicted ATP-dependent endonuclease of OLD family
MRITSITINGFRCFDHDGQTITLDDLTCFVGPNASGKTAAMLALGRLFGEAPVHRQVVPADFHLSPSEKLKDQSPRTLSIECKLEFPELEDEEGDIGDAVPETFNQMIIDLPGGKPFCRIRLEATWTNDGTTSGDVEQTLSWLLTESDDPGIIRDHRQKVQSADRGRIRLIYVPATRDPDQQIRATASTAFGRLLEAISWDGADRTLEEKLKELQNEVGVLPGVTTMNTQVQASWSTFYDGRVARDIAFQALDQDPSQLLKMLVPVFRPGEDGLPMAPSGLSDGLRSLFSLSLSMGLYKVEGVIRNDPASAGFVSDVKERLPILTVFAVEEPENHLSPHYFGRVLSQLGVLAGLPGAQVLLSSHSPSILARVKPDNVRYFLGHENATASRVKPLPLPKNQTDEAFKYVREAVKGFPELYFSRLVILGEGASEEIVLRHLLEANGAPLDTHFISVVPLGGRHVNHFWRLLHGLEIPFLTLLDLDREKEGAGWGRIQYVRNQLVALHGSSSSDLRVDMEDGRKASLADKAYDNLDENDVKEVDDMTAWMDYFRDKFSVFFMTPLDLDFSMLEAFPDVYQSLSKGLGPRLPKPNSPDYAKAIQTRVEQVLTSNRDNVGSFIGFTYTDDQRKLFPWYKYLFLDGSKPVAHMRALIEISNEDLRNKAPRELGSLIKKIQVLLGPP